VPLGVDKSYKPAVHCEAALNQLVQFSIQHKSLAWVSLNTGFPSTPLRLSEVCRDFQGHLASKNPAADQKRLSTCFAGTNVVHHNVTGSAFLESDMFPSACRGMDATGPEAPLHEQEEWLRTMLRSITHPRMQKLEVVILIIPVPRVLTNDDVFSSAMYEAFHTAPTWSYR
jgi:hypothetical protein